MAFKVFKKTDFYKLMSDQADKTKEGVEALLEFINNPTQENGNRVYQLEGEADEIRRILIDDLNRTFVTPIDREDIFALSRAVDDVLDYVKTTVEEMSILNIKPDASMREMIETLLDGTKNMVGAVKNIKEHPGVCTEYVIKARKSEQKIEKLYRLALANLFKTNNVIEILKTREIYRHLSNAADRVEVAANVISDILVKNA